MKISIAIDGPAAAGKSTVAKKIAEIKGVSEEKVEKITTDNANGLFDF